MSKYLMTNNIRASQIKVTVSTPFKYAKYSNYVKVTFSFVTNKVLRNKSILDVVNLPMPRRQLRRSTHTQVLRCYAATSFATRVSSLYWHFGALGVVFRILGFFYYIFICLDNLKNVISRTKYFLLYCFVTRLGTLKLRPGHTEQT